jgi:hypothetical protein
LLAVCLVLPWIIIFVSVPPGVQNFPINDDWAFSKGLRDLLDGKSLLHDRPPDAVYQGWSSMPLFGQWLWALPWVSIFGFSHATLRLSTIVLSWLGLWAFYDLLRQQGLCQKIAVFTTIALAWTPYMMFLTATFMTDSTTLSFSLIALAFYNRALKHENLHLLIWATVAALFGTTTRQSTIMAPAAAAIMVASHPQARRQAGWWVALAVPVAICIALHRWCAHRWDTMPRTARLIPIEQIRRGPYYILHFMGLFTLPVLIMVKGRFSYLRWGLSLGLTAAAVVAIGLDCYTPQASVPGLQWPQWLQPLTWLHWFERLPWFPYLKEWFPESMQVQGFGLAGLPAMYMSMPYRIVLTVLGIAGMVALLPRMIDWLPGLGKPASGSPHAVSCWRHPDILIVFTVLQLVVLSLSTFVYDRYFVTLVPGFFAIAAIVDRGQLVFRPWLGVSALAASVILSTAVTHDMLETHSAIWRLGNRAVQNGVASDGMVKLKPQEIDGGMEWDGWYSPRPARWRYSHQVPSVRGLNWEFNQINWDRLSGFYAISLASPDDFRCRSIFMPARTVDEEPYTLWAPPEHRQAYLMKEDPALYPSAAPDRGASRGSKAPEPGK